MIISTIELYTTEIDSTIFYVLEEFCIASLLGRVETPHWCRITGLLALDRQGKN